MPSIKCFADIANLSDPDVQALLRRMDIEDCTTALMEADENVKQALFRNMSERVRTFIQENMQTRERTPSSEISSVQERICQLAQSIVG